MNKAKMRQLGFWGISVLTPLGLALTAGCPPVVVEEDNGPPPPPQPVYVQAPAPAPVVVPADAALQQLVAPIALYPDPLLAVLLPASTYPDQIQQAAYWAQMNQGAPDAVIAQQPWDPSVQALVHYPSVLQYMNGDMQWTTSLGSAFASDQGSVMNAIQELRQQAYACGTLQSSPQMDVIVDGPVIYLQPANPDVICVPSYDAVYCYQRPEPLTFGVQYGVGVWLGFAFDWSDRSVYRGDWHEGWQPESGGWHRAPDWRPPQAQPWVRDASHGPPPRVEPAHYVAPQQIRGHEQEFRAAPPVRATPAKPMPKEVPDAAHRTDLPPQSQGQVRPDDQRQPVVQAAPAQHPQQQPDQQHSTADRTYQGQPMENPQRPTEANGPGPKGPGTPAAADKGPAPKGPAQDKSKQPAKPAQKPQPTDKQAPQDKDHDQDQNQNQNQDQSKMPQR